MSKDNNKIVIEYNNIDDDNNDNNDNNDEITVKKINNNFKKIDETYSFEEQINLLREIAVPILSDYCHMKYNYDQELNLKVFKLKYAHLSNELDEKLFEEIFGDTFVMLANKLINTTSKEENQIQIFFLCVCIYKMINVTKGTYEANCIEVITDTLGELWLNERHHQQQLRHKNLPALANKYDKKYNKCRSELIVSNKQSCRKFIHNDLALKIIMNCRTYESCNLKMKLQFTLYDVINTKEQTVINSIKDIFEEEDIQTKCTVLNLRIDFFFS